MVYVIFNFLMVNEMIDCLFHSLYYHFRPKWSKTRISLKKRDSLVYSNNSHVYRMKLNGLSLVYCVWRDKKREKERERERGGNENKNK